MERPDFQDFVAPLGASIRAKDVGRRFIAPTGPIDAIRNISLTIEPGQFCVIVGPSGCGKSTLLRLIAGLDAPTSGTLEISRPGAQTPTNAVVFQGRSLFPWLTVRENLAYGLALRRASRIDQRATTDRLLSTLGITRFGDVYPHQISEGMRQRVAIGRALAVDPDLLLMDEPFGALDEQTRLILQDELLRIWDQTGKTVVFITHSIDEAIVLADYVVVMSAQPGSIRAIIDVPLPRPRSLMDVRRRPEFSELYAQTWELLKDEVTRARQSQDGDLLV